MTFPIWLEVVCAKCSRCATGRYTFKGQIPLRDIKNCAKAEGFVFKHGDAFCSESCAQEYFDEYVNN